MKTYLCFHANVDECGIVYVQANTRGMAKHFAVAHFASEGGWDDISFLDIRTRLVKEKSTLDWLDSFVEIKDLPQIINDDAMFCHNCEHPDGGLYYLRHSNEMHVCATDGEED